MPSHRMSYVSDSVSRLGREQYLSRRKEHGEDERRRRRAGPKKPKSNPS